MREELIKYWFLLIHFGLFHESISTSQNKGTRQQVIPVQKLAFLPGIITPKNDSAAEVEIEFIASICTVNMLCKASSCERLQGNKSSTVSACLVAHFHTRFNNPLDVHHAYIYNDCTTAQKSNTDGFHPYCSVTCRKTECESMLSWCEMSKVLITCSSD